MAKFLFLLFFIIISSGSFGQRQIVGLSLTPLIDVWKPFSIPLETLNSDRIKISSFTLLIGAHTQVVDKEKWGVAVGLGYKSISYKVKDYLESFTYTHHVSGSDQVTVLHEFKDQADLVAVSNSFGLNTDWYYKLFSKERVNGSVGLRCEAYFLEYYKSWYASSDAFESSQGALPIPNQGPGRKLFFSSMNTSLFYKTSLLLKGEYTRISVKISAGANLYSDWEQFKRNAWVGIGLGLDFISKKKN